MSRLDTALESPFGIAGFRPLETCMFARVHDQITKVGELRRREALREEVGHVVGSPAEEDVNEVLVDVLTDSKEPDVEVLRPWVHGRVVGREDRALVIAEDRDGRGRLADHVRGH